MWAVQRLGRRAWLTRTGAGLLAVWAGLDFGRGQQGWGVLLGRPARTAHAQNTPAMHTLPVSIDFTSSTGEANSVNAFVLVRGREVAIVDTLLAGNAARIGETIQTVGLGWDAVRHVIVTHFHGDHQGSADAITGLATRATVWAGEPDIPQLTVSRPVQPAYDGDEVFGLRIVSTPGHTPGHISVLDPVGSALMTGDALFNDATFNRAGGGLALNTAPATFDRETSLQSLQKLGALSFERVLFGHGEPISSGGAAAIATFAARAEVHPEQIAHARLDCCGEGELHA
jgi:glyoxylase-like metal-dependent hydrolase (beta-lactamase superfamily II)